jgi:hypothetical protein
MCADVLCSHVLLLCAFCADYYWGLVTVYRRLSLVASWVFLSDSKQTRIGVVSLLNVIFMSLQIWKAPYGEAGVCSTLSCSVSSPHPCDGCTCR